MYKIIGGDGQEYGPVTEDQVRQWLQEGRANAQSQIRREGDVNWTTVGALPEFGFSAAGAVPPSNVPPTAPRLDPNVKVPNYLVQSILVTLCCCLPFGIPAIVYAAQVNGKVAQGDLAGALASSAKARKWCWIAFCFGIVSSLVGFLMGALGGLRESMPQ